jgi:hypothetical protein
MERYRKPKIKTNSLVFQKGKIDGAVDMCIFWDNIPACDRSLIFYYLASENINYGGGKLKSFIQELEDRGYDLDTLRFSIEKKKIV